MKAGRELDKLIAEKVFNVEVEGELIKRYIDDRWWVKLPHYSTNISDAWLVREWMINNVGGVRLEHLCDANKPELCEVWDGWKYIRVQAETTLLAICLVAIMIVDNVNIVDKGR